jgi:hypothetical protein
VRGSPVKEVGKEKIFRDKEDQSMHNETTKHCLKKSGVQEWNREVELAQNTLWASMKLSQL